ncbi:uncharacterized protein LOC126581901 isoform X1 [Malus sylvestris]|uniref:uncharacterized protein LOC126581901 isoform X1 n=1 Tax=Malus sylvestris TaxID=3752 RepID=UPI0021AD4DE6|nr:uncharacterized protein LOC126581901 isoform X1 [Malus sylvestris]
MTLAAKLQLKGYTPTGARRLASSTRLSLFRLFLLLPICGSLAWPINSYDSMVRNSLTYYLNLRHWLGSASGLRTSQKPLFEMSRPM